MTPHELIRQGKVKEALAALKEAIIADASNPRLRMFYFQLLAIMGDWKKSQEQLETAASMDPSQLPVKYEVLPLIRCEAIRAEVFAGKQKPLVMGETSEWIEMLLRSLELLSIGKTNEAVTIQAQALAKAPPSTGTIDGNTFDWIADSDSRLGPIIEAYIDEKYYWVPFTSIEALTIESPTNLRDLVWTQATFALRDGNIVTGFIPTRYPGTESCSDNECLMAKSVTWQEFAPNYQIGRGVRILMTAQNDYPISQIRLIHISPQQI